MGVVGTNNPLIYCNFYCRVNYLDCRIDNVYLWFEGCVA